MKNCLICLISFAFCVHFVEAQTKYSTDSKRAIKLYEEAREHFSKRKFEDGVENLLKAIEIDDKFIEAHFQLAVTYELFQDFDEAAIYYRNIIAISPDDAKYKKAYFYVAKKDISVGDYRNAKKNAETFIKLNKNVSNKETAYMQTIIKNCNYAEEAMKKPLIYKPELLETPLNKLRVQYFPVLTGDQNTIIFTAHVEDVNNKRQETHEDMYISYKNQGKWSAPISISPKINTIDNEGTCSISADGKTLVFTYCNNEKLRPCFGSCDLYISQKNGEEWSIPINLGSNVNTASKDTQPSLSADGKTLYFASNRPGGFGGLDIWMSKMGDNNNWLPAVNLGNSINTSQDDVSPFIHANGKTLYFSSMGFDDMCFGGFDIYQTEYITSQWTKPQNLGYPINNHSDQVGLFISTDGTKGYYTLEQKEANTAIRTAKLYSFDVPQEIRPKQKSNYVKGNVYDSKTKAKLDAKIDLFNLTDNTKQASVNSDAKDGSYLIVLSEGSEYALEVNRKGYAFKSLTFNYVESSDIKPLEIDIPLDPIAKGTVFRLNNIFFDYNQFDLKEKSKTELDELVKFMKENETVRGEISGHTDNIGVAQANQTLSLNRAKSVYEYLIKAGVDAKRLTFKGYGASKPDATNDTEEGRAKNRRIEFEIL